ncbi:helix-turn-helix domain-containing protein [Kutzneria albida]|uniref:HTH luxR-type domain-containing protein n=1 Tax=Kutzneria albida DSM 43870 TaxID=1449976 RepID=W5WCW7_9PSEU|nr:helix-turn-helix domain-containing protein [Kutzneria albida]AHH98411.1 hypothetical protein KALB_5049 [Kutzneria albida DSM 43870]
MALAEIGHLVTLGLGNEAAELYSSLLANGSRTVAQLAELAGCSEEQTCRRVAELVEVGLVVRVGDGRALVTPVPPNPALELLSRRREAELAQARVATASAYQALHRMVGDTGEHLLEVISGPEVEDRITQLERSVRAEVRGLDSPPYYAVGVANQVEMDNLANGVRYRAVYAKPALERSEYLAENVVPSVRAGEEARTLPDVPVKLLILDTDCAVVSLSAAEAEVGGTAVLIRPSSLLSAMIGLFEVCWRAALPLSLGEQRTGPFLQPSERRLLALLAAGLGDEQIARTLGISRRTLFRYLEVLMSRTGAANRFQLALHAKRNGWI